MTNAKLINNINSKDYWNNRFKQDWIEKGGTKQTVQHMLSIISILNKYIPNTFSGQILDFGCALGNGMPVLHHFFPFAKLIGVDYSKTAIDHCIKQYGNLADFICSEDSDIPSVDVIISLHCMEHITDDKALIRELLDKCLFLFITVPYNQDIKYVSEHIHSYNKYYFNDFTELKNIHINLPRQYNFLHQFISFVWNVFKNILRILLGKGLVYRTKQITYYFFNTKPSTDY